MKPNFPKVDLLYVSIYHSYQKDFKGDYSMTICEEELLDKYFDKSNYWWKTYEVAQENQLDLVETWLKIWMEEEQKIIQRAYDFDYAVYHSLMDKQKLE